jgi:hypothetical protein
VGLLFILGIVLGITVHPGWFWMSAIIAMIVLAAELAADW